MPNYEFQITKGFTLIELILAMGIFSALIGISTISLVNIQHKTSVFANINIFSADLRQQQLRAMVADTGGSGNVSDYGAHFTASSYTLFRGSVYSAGDSSNFIVNIPNPIQLSPVPPDLIFAKGSGEIVAATTIIFKDTQDNSQKTVSINKYGVVTGVN